MIEWSFFIKLSIIIYYRVGKERLAVTLRRKHVMRRKLVKTAVDVVRKISKLIKAANPPTKGELAK